MRDRQTDRERESCFLEGERLLIMRERLDFQREGDC